MGDFKIISPPQSMKSIVPPARFVSQLDALASHSVMYPRRVASGYLAAFLSRSSSFSANFLVQPLWRVGEKVAVLVHRAALNRHVGPSAASALSRPACHRQ